MQNLLNDLKELLKQDERLVADGELLKNKVVELALKLDPSLIQLLISHARLKDHFFTKIGDIHVFKEKDFIKFVSNKEFLPDSFTSFANKLGLTVNSEYIKEQSRVILAWPYKDCVLEGDMKKEDEERDEIFYNEILAPDEIDRLLEPKVLTHFKKIDNRGKHKIKDLSPNENILIKGNNLLVLHTLAKRYQGRVKLIYIDPPYNTGGGTDTFSYNNTFKHSTWLTFMKNRIQVARDLLRSDGFVAVTIDHVELFYLGTLLDEIFGRENRIGIVTIYINPKGRQHERFFSAATEYMLVYAKDVGEAEFNDVTLDEETKRAFAFSDDLGNYRLEQFIRARTSTLRDKKPNFWYPIYVSKDLKDITLVKKPGYNEVFPTRNGRDYTWKTRPETFQERNHNGYFVAQENNGNIEILHKYYEQQVIKNLWIDKKYFPEFQGTNLLKKLLGKNLFSYPKSLYAVIDTLKIMTEEDDFILDFFAGSGTTGHAVLELNKEDNGRRRFILVEQLDYIETVTKARLKKVIQNNKNGPDWVKSKESRSYESPLPSNT